MARTHPFGAVLVAGIADAGDHQGQADAPHLRGSEKRQKRVVRRRFGQEMQIDAPFRPDETFITPGTEVAVDVPYEALIGLAS